MVGPESESGRDPIFGDAVRAAMAGLSRLDDPLQVADLLRARLPGPLARRAAELHALRARSKKKFPRFDLPFLTRKGLEQASAEAVANARAARVAARASGARVADVTCGIGADSVALARAGLATVSCDRDALLAACARENLRAMGLPARVLVAEAERPAVRADLVVVDPDRRSGGRRTLDPAAWSPTLDDALALAHRHAGACLKLAPAFDPERAAGWLPAGLPARWQWVESRGELCEVGLWTGVLAGCEAGEAEREATLVEAGAHISGRPERVLAWAPAEAERCAWLAEPAAAVIRSGLLGLLAARSGLRPLAARIAYLGGPQRPKSPFLTVWRVLGVERLDPRRVRRLLARHDVGELEVRRRGHPERPEELAARLRGRGARRGTLVVTRLEDGHRAFLVEAEAAPTAAEGPLVGDEGFEPPTSSL